MSWLIYLAHFFGGAFLVNAVPHFVQGLSGAPFQTPFAKPRGVGESSPLANVIWGAFNFAVAAGLLYYLRPLDLNAASDMAAAILGGAAIGAYLALHFGKVRAGGARKDED